MDFRWWTSVPRDRLACRGRLGLILVLSGVATEAVAVARDVAAPHFDHSGPVLRQSFVGETVSHVATRTGAACIASETIPVAISTYRGPEGETVPFARVTRSVAASIQYIVPTGGDAPFFRIQLKYPLRRDSEVRLFGSGVSLDLADALEPSGDSLRIATPARVEALRAALRRGAATLRAMSADTGRIVTDPLPTPDFAGARRCAAAQAPEAASAPGLGLVVAAAPTKATRIDPEALAACAMTPGLGPVHRGEIVSASGFFAQTRSAYVVFDQAGDARQVYVPGVFEAIRRADGSYAVDVSIAARSNDPLQVNAVKGCLGDEPATLCPALAKAGAVSLGRCLGDVFAFEDLFDDASFLIAELEDGDESFSFEQTAEGDEADELATPVGRARPERGAAAFGLSGGGFGGGASRSGAGDDPISVFEEASERATPAPVPLPASAWLLLAGLGALTSLRRRR